MNQSRTGSYVGGVCGFNDGTVELSCSTGPVYGIYCVGGVVGKNFSTLTTSCATGLVSGKYYIGGVCGGTIGGPVSPCYWDAEVSGLSVGCTAYGEPEFPSTVNVHGKTTAEMQIRSTFTSFDFESTWMILRDGEDYPRLMWQEVFPGDIAGLYGVDLVDFSYLSGYWGLDDCGGSDDCGRADIDENGQVDISDLVELANDWLKS